MGDSLLYKLRSGKPPKIFFFLKGYLLMCMPTCFFRLCRKRYLAQVETRSDKDYIYERVNYYNKMRHPVALPDKTFREHFDYKFIMALEGNDVASNLKWVMSSNSIAVMTRPTCETWFMEGKLIPDYHYIEIKDDLSDLEEKLNYYIAHPAEAEQIVEHAHEYVSQFFDAGRERLISLLVMDKYFQVTKQTSNC